MRRLTPAPGLAGRVPRRRTLVWLWAAAVAGMGVLLAAAGATAGALDDPDPAHQRPGLLDVFGLPVPAPALDGALPASGDRTVVFFSRPARLAELCTALAGGDLPAWVTVVVVVAVPGAPCPAASALIGDPGHAAAAYGMRPPRDGGPPVGYAVVDRMRRIRYRTLDPGVASRLGEVRTIVAALP